MSHERGRENYGVYLYKDLLNSSIWGETELPFSSKKEGRNHTAIAPQTKHAAQKVG